MRRSRLLPTPGKFVWYDLLSADVDTVSKFYTGLLGWKFVAIEAPNYTLIAQDGRAIGGMVNMPTVDPDSTNPSASACFRFRRFLLRFVPPRTPTATSM